MSKSKIKVSFSIEADDDSDFMQELEFLDSKKLISRIRQVVADYIREKARDQVGNPDFFKDLNIDFDYGTYDERLSIVNNLKNYVSNENNFRINNPNALDDGY